MIEELLRRRKAIIGYITLGYPDKERSLEAGGALISAGCDILELGIPSRIPSQTDP